MKIADRTPFRTANGTIDFLGRAQGTLKYGINWYARLEAQDAVIAVLDKVLGVNYILLRNVTLPNTDIDLPLVLIGPPGVYLVYVIHERGVYRAKEEEWGTVIGDKLVPAPINQLQRTVKLGRVLQLYLDRAGFKGIAAVDPILMAASPGLHIESVRPAARIVMSDALERFAISMNQAREVLTSGLISSIAKTILTGPAKVKEESPAADSAQTLAAPVNSGRDTSDTLFSGVQQQDTISAANTPTLSFPFVAGGTNQDASKTVVSVPNQDANKTFVSSNADNSGDQDFRNVIFRDDDQPASSQTFETLDATPTYNFSETPEPGQPVNQPAATAAPKTSTNKKKTLLGMTPIQLLILGGIFLFWLCAIAVFAGYIIFSQ